MKTDTIDREAILTWARRWSADRKPAVMFSLTYVAKMEQFSPLGVRPVTKSLSQEDRYAEIEDVVDTFIRQAKVWSATKQRPQTFAIGAHRTEDPAVAPVDQFPLVIQAERRHVTPGTMPTITVRLESPNLKKDLDRAADVAGLSLTQFVNETLKARISDQCPTCGGTAATRHGRSDTVL